MTEQDHRHIDHLRDPATKILTTTAAADTHDPARGQVDFADFFAGVLAATAANLGGTDRLLATRPDSWEAELVETLIDGTPGYPPDWIRYRNESVYVPLKVAQLIETHPCHYQLLGIDDVQDGLDATFWPRRGDTEPNPEQDDYEQVVAAIEARYQAAYRQFGREFSASAHAQHLGTWSRVEVEADLNPRSRWRNPDTAVTYPEPFAASTDPAVVRLRAYAHDVTPLPNVDIRSHASQASRQ